MFLHTQGWSYYYTKFLYELTNVPAHAGVILKVLKKYRENPNGSVEEEYELQFAWDRYERYLNAQSKAMDTLTRMIGKYEELCNSGIATEEQLLRIEKLKTEVNILKGVSDEIEDLSDIQKLIYGKEDD